MSRAVAMEKVTFALPADMTEKVREAVRAGLFESQNALVREALRKELERLREAQIERQYEVAAADPLYLQDIVECMRDFALLDAETAALIDEAGQSS